MSRSKWPRLPARSISGPALPLKTKDTQIAARCRRRKPGKAPNPGRGGKEGRYRVNNLSSVERDKEDRQRGDKTGQNEELSQLRDKKKMQNVGG